MARLLHFCSKPIIRQPTLKKTDMQQHKEQVYRYKYLHLTLNIILVLKKNLAILNSQITNVTLSLNVLKAYSYCSCVICISNKIFINCCNIILFGCIDRRFGIK